MVKKKQKTVSDKTSANKRVSCYAGRLGNSKSGPAEQLDFCEGNGDHFFAVNSNVRGRGEG